MPLGKRDIALGRVALDAGRSVMGRLGWCRYHYHYQMTIRSCGASHIGSPGSMAKAA